MLMHQSTMVNLPSEETLGDGGVRTTSRGHRNWRNRCRRRDRLNLRTEPKGLLELEDLARKTVSLMEKYSPKSEHNFDKAMDLLRLQYNLNFMILCEKCCGFHRNDELIAPER